MLVLVLYGFICLVKCCLMLVWADCGCLDFCFVLVDWLDAGLLFGFMVVILLIAVLLV